LVDIDPEGYLSLMLETGDVRSDLKSEDEDIAKQIQERWEAGADADVFVTVLSAMGREKVIAVKTGNK